MEDNKMPAIFQLERTYQDTWVVLDRAQQVVDSGDQLDALRRKHGRNGRLTFCFVSGCGQSAPASDPSPWSLRALLGHPPVGLQLALARP
ncbi:MAG TPA: hypothetical protein DEB40_05655 [Elusimicrobia bacterium]|nr:hypothetical protein [Elusimicrobiota bacterium]HBT61210.1 hypothetical protein [Elusimicrobiota bacterium]